MTILSVVFYEDNKGLEASWFKETKIAEAESSMNVEARIEREQLKCVSYHPTQMVLFRADAAFYGTPLDAYEAQMLLIESSYVPEPPPKLPPIRISPWQLRKALTRTGLRLAVEQAVANSVDQDLKDGWKVATEIIEDDEFVIGMFIALGKTDAERHEFMLFASTL